MSKQKKACRRESSISKLITKRSVEKISDIMTTAINFKLKFSHIWRTLDAPHSC